MLSLATGVCSRERALVTARIAVVRSSWASASWRSSFGFWRWLALAYWPVEHGPILVVSFP